MNAPTGVLPLQTLQIQIQIQKNFIATRNKVFYVQ